MSYNVIWIVIYNYYNLQQFNKPAVYKNKNKILSRKIDYNLQNRVIILYYCPVAQTINKNSLISCDNGSINSPINNFIGSLKRQTVAQKFL